MASQHQSDTPVRNQPAWCGTQPSLNIHEEDLVPTPPEMADVQDTPERYPCVTQKGLEPTIGQPPFEEQPDNGEGPEPIVVGIGSIIPRWKASTTKPTKLLYYVIREGFKNDEDFEYTATAMKEAADEWNAIEFGLELARTEDRALANFVVKYIKPEVEEGVLASAFFPNEVEDLLVYDFTLVSPTWRPRLKGTLLHELGHVVGLRHEFAIVADDLGNGPEGFGAVQFGSKNPNSVMSYQPEIEIQDTDKTDVKAFYKLPNRSKIEGSNSKIHDYKPKPLKQ